MGCLQSFLDNDPRKDTCISSYKVTFNDIDKELLELWNQFLRGDGEGWRELQRQGKTAKKKPALFWGDEFKDRMLSNISQTRPDLAKDLGAHPPKAISRILVGIAKYCLINFHIESVSVQETEIERIEQLYRIGRAHCKWDVKKDAFVHVQNAMIDVLRLCLGPAFKPEFDARIRHKFSILADVIDRARYDFEKMHGSEALKVARLACP